MPTNPSSQLVNSDDWPFTPTDERQLIFERFCDSEQLTEIGNSYDINWFDENTVSYRTREEARAAIANRFQTPTELQDVLQSISLDSTRFGWFRGYHYVVEMNDATPTVREGPATAVWKELVDEVQHLVADNDALAAFLHGIVDVALDDETRFIDFSTAESTGSQYVDGGRLSANRVATDPGLIAGITTRKGSSSGRTYYVAPELMPIVQIALRQYAAQDAGPVETPGQTVPDSIDRRIPKFDEVLADVEVSEADIDRFESILADTDALEYWKDYVAPGVMFRPQAKKAVLCLLASLEDKHGSKGRTNAIMYGPPGTGKTAFKNFLIDEFGAFSIDGARVSKADLTYNKATDEDGLLVRANKGLAVIEEADEMDDDALGAALTALGESGRLEIRDMRLPAEVRGILIGNYESRQDVIDHHSEAIFDRFEFVLPFERLDDEQRDAAIDWHIEHYRQPKHPEDTEELKQFIAWVREFEPDLSEDAAQRIKEFKRDRIETFSNVREGNAVMSVAATIARLNHRDISLGDYETAYKLVINDI